MIKVKGKENLVYEIEKEILELECQSGSFFKYTVHLSLSKIIEILINIGTELFTISFYKSQSEENIVNTKIDFKKYSKPFEFTPPF